MTSRSSGAQSAPGPISPASAANIPTTGIATTCAIRARWCPARSCRTMPSWRRPISTTSTSPRILKVQALLGVPYTADMIAHAAADVVTQATTDSPDAADLAKRYPKAQARDFDGNPGRITEADALIAYLQMLGTRSGFQALRRQSQHPVTAMDATYQSRCRIRADLGSRLFRRHFRAGAASTRCGRRARSSSTKRRAFRCGRIKSWPIQNKNTRKSTR